LGRATREFLFISDAPKEVESAEIAGFRALLCGRAASPLVTPRQTIRSFDEVLPD
jgi:methionine salvage enolase-phosphatase E1